MKAAILRLTALAMALVPVAVACSDASGVRVVDGPDGLEDSGTQPSPIPSSSDDSGAPDADPGPTDAGADASDASLTKPTCTKQGWCHTVVPDAQTLRDVWGDGQGTVWTVSTQGNILRWDGKAWVQSYAAGTALYAVWGSGPTDLWVGGANGLLHGTGTSPSTITWTAVPASVPVYSIWGTGAADVWAVGYTAVPASSFNGGRILHYAGPGAGPDPDTDWTSDPVSTELPGRFNKVWGTGADDVWVAGDTGYSSGRALHRRPDGAGGFTWSSAGPAAASSNFRGAASISRTDVFLLGFGPAGTYYRGASADDGATFTWTKYDTVDYAHIAVWGADANDIWLGGIFGRLRHWDGVKWSIGQIALDDLLPVIKTFNALWGTGTDDVWAVGEGIALHKGAPEAM